MKHGRTLLSKYVTDNGTYASFKRDRCEDMPYKDDCYTRTSELFRVMPSLEAKNNKNAKSDGNCYNHKSKITSDIKYLISNHSSRETWVSQAVPGKLLRRGMSHVACARSPWQSVRCLKPLLGSLEHALPSQWLLPRSASQRACLLRRLSRADSFSAEAFHHLPAAKGLFAARWLDSMGSIS